MTISITRAAVEHLPDLIRIHVEGQELHARLFPDLFRADCDAAELDSLWRDRLASDAMTVAVASSAGAIVGSIVFELQDRPQSPFRYASQRIYVHHLVVEQSSKRTGAGKAMLEFAEAEARRLGACEISLDCWCGNDDAQEFFGAQGYEPTNLLRSKRL